MNDGKFIRFIEVPMPERKTKQWAVMNNTGTAIGTVKWYGAWRRYCFFPGVGTLFEEQCLRDIAMFCETRTELHKNGQAV